MYHSIANDASPRFRKFAVPPERFAAQMDYLQEHGYQPLTVTAFAQLTAQNGSQLPARPVVLTFDDGFADFYSAALPTLLAHDFTATLYITTGFVGDASRWLWREGEGKRPILSWDQIAEVKASGIECGGHTHTHRQLDMLPPAVARDEIARCKEILEERLGQTIATFAYPFGYFNPRVRRMVQETGYGSACAVNYRMSSVRDDRFALGRLIVTGDMGLETFARLLAGKGSVARDRTRTIAWQLVRRCVATIKYRQKTGMAHG